jgi:hypothetical protein
MRLFVLIIYILMNKVFAKGVDAEAVVLMAARASRLENQDAIDTAIVGTLADPKEVSFDLLFTASFLLAYL